MGVYFLGKYDGPSESVAFAQNWVTLQTRMDQRVDHMKINFGYFQIQKWMLQTIRVEKVDKKWSVNCPKKCSFCNFVLTSVRFSVKVIYIWLLKVALSEIYSYYSLSENDMVYYRGLSHRSWDISD